MRKLLIVSWLLVGTNLALGNDEILVRSQEKPIKAPIKSESVRGLVLSTLKNSVIPTEDIVDVVYDLSLPSRGVKSAILVKTQTYQPGIFAEREAADPKKAKQRKSLLATAVAKYEETLKKVPDKAVRRHLQYKIAMIKARLVEEGEGKPEEAIEDLKNFKALHYPDCWQIGEVLQTLARLQVANKNYDGATETFDALANIMDLPQEARNEAALMAARVNVKAGKHELALKKLQNLEKSFPKGSRFATLARISQADCMVATGKTKEAVGMLRSIIKETSDKGLKASAYNTVGECFLKLGQAKDARWEFLWVDVVYNQDREEHARALYHLWKTFGELGETQRAQECRDALVNDRQFAGLEWQRRALAEGK